MFPPDIKHLKDTLHTCNGVSISIVKLYYMNCCGIMKEGELIVFDLVLSHNIKRKRKDIH